MKFFSLFFTVLALLISASSAMAAGPWQAGHGYQVRLLNGGMHDDDGRYYVGVHIRLDAGWKTYWRAPGDSGIPPKLSFKQSANLKAAKVHWPVPKLFSDQYGMSVGYKGDVILPVAIEPMDKNKPVDLHLSLFFGVCEQVCVPAEEALEKTIMPKNAPANDKRIVSAALDDVPKMWTKQAADSVIHLSAVALKSTKNKEVVRLTLHPRHDMKDVTILLEGPQDWFLEPTEMPLMLKASEKGQVVDIPLHRIIREPLTGEETVRITFIAGDHALEKVIALP